MLKGISKDDVLKYSWNKDTEPKTVFHIRPLSALDKMSIGAEFAQDSTFGKAYILEYLSKSIFKIENPNIDKKEDISEFVSNLSDVEAIAGLFEKVRSLSEITDGDKKN